MTYRIGYMNTVHYEKVSSTMDVIIEHLQNDIDHPILVVAKQQIEGRGRQDSDWFSPEGGFYGTFAFPLSSKLQPKQYSFLHYAAALAIQQTIKKKYGPEILVKWPNDIVFQTRKLGGILLELVSLHSEYLLLGIGINIELKEENTLAFERLRATSLEEVTGIQIQKNEFTNILSEFIFEYVNLIMEENHEKIISLFKMNSLNMNKKHSYKSEVYLCRGISNTGELILESPDKMRVDVHINESNNLIIIN
ncbi:MAG: biotin--[acetyl-CoA-carboxylase] ligase [Candidatus Heimdallarchaeota archaeon]|nr:biotin--[acetyl-CoA-carboxylase] ligase [Candidatus Heimdallarchaeota archaeon]